MRRLRRKAEPERKPPRARRAFTHASDVLRRLADEAPRDAFTLGWLMTQLRNRSFGMVMLLLAAAAIAPGVSIVAGLLLLVPALQMMAGYAAPGFPRRIARRPMRTRHLTALVQRAAPLLRYLETLVHPRWPLPPELTARLVGAIVALLSITLVFSPIPLSNVVPALVIAVIALAYLEEDGLVLCLALAAGLVVLTVGGLAVWETFAGARWLRRLG